VPGRRRARDPRGRAGDVVTALASRGVVDQWDPPLITLAGVYATVRAVLVTVWSVLAQLPQRVQPVPAEAPASTGRHARPYDPVSELDAIRALVAAGQLPPQVLADAFAGGGPR
jgi:hypothetical protein